MILGQHRADGIGTETRPHEGRAHMTWCEEHCCRRTDDPTDAAEAHCFAVHDDRRLEAEATMEAEGLFEGRTVAA